MPELRNRYCLYVDETSIDGLCENNEKILIIGGLLLENKLCLDKRTISSDWFCKILNSPHANEAKNLETSRDIVSGFFRDCPNSRFFAVGGAVEDSVSYVNHILTLIIRAAMSGSIGPRDVLVAHPERYAEHWGFETQMKITGAVASLKWLNKSARRFPEISVEVYPQDPHILFGQSIVDHLLWSLQKEIRSETVRGKSDWLKKAKKAFKSFGIDGFCDIIELQRFEKPEALLPYQQLLLKDFESFDWKAFAKSESDYLVSQLKNSVPEMPEKIRPAIALHFIEQVGEYVENPQEARNEGFSQSFLKQTAEIVERLVEGINDPAVEAKIRYLLMRVNTHAGNPARARLEYQKGVSLLLPQWLTPEDLNFWIKFLRASMVVLTDLRKFEETSDAFRKIEELCENHYRNFIRIPELGKAFGAMGQACVLAGRPDEAYDYFEEQRGRLGEKADFSYEITWKLIALGRGATPKTRSIRDEIAELFARARDEAEASLEDLRNNPFILWGLMEAWAGRGTVSIDEEIRSAATKGVEALSEEPPARLREHPLPLIFRAAGMAWKSAKYFNLSYSLTPVYEDRLKMGAIKPRIGIKTLVAWTASGCEPPLDELLDAKGKAKRTVALWKTRPEFSEIGSYLKAFLNVGESDPRPLNEFLRMGEL